MLLSLPQPSFIFLSPSLSPSNTLRIFSISRYLPPSPPDLSVSLSPSLAPSSRSLPLLLSLSLPLPSLSAVSLSFHLQHPSVHSAQIQGKRLKCVTWFVIHLIPFLLFVVVCAVLLFKTSQMFNHRLLAARNAITRTLRIYFCVDFFCSPLVCVKLIGISPIGSRYFDYYCYFISDFSCDHVGAPCIYVFILIT